MLLNPPNYPENQDTQAKPVGRKIAKAPSALSPPSVGLRSPEPTKKREAPSSLQNLEFLSSDFVVIPNLCNLSCKALAPAINRMNAYGSGELPADETTASDPAFQLAKLFHQAALGPSGQDFYKLMLILEDPWNIRSIGFPELVWRISSLILNLEARTEDHAAEADAYIREITTAAGTCENLEWAKDCRLLEDELKKWIYAGALR